MDEITYSLLVLGLIAIGVGGLIWANSNFPQMTRWLGGFSRWGYLVPTTRLGMSAAMLGTIFIGLSALPPRLLFYPDNWRSVFVSVFLVLAIFGLLHDLASWPRGNGR